MPSTEPQQQETGASSTNSSINTSKTPQQELQAEIAAEHRQKTLTQHKLRQSLNRGLEREDALIDRVDKYNERLIWGDMADEAHATSGETNEGDAMDLGQIGDIAAEVVSIHAPAPEAAKPAPSLLKAVVPWLTGGVTGLAAIGSVAYLGNKLIDQMGGTEASSNAMEDTRAGIGLGSVEDVIWPND